MFFKSRDKVRTYILLIHGSLLANPITYLIHIYKFTINTTVIYDTTYVLSSIIYAIHASNFSLRLMLTYLKNQQQQGKELKPVMVYWPYTWNHVCVCFPGTPPLTLSHAPIQLIFYHYRSISVTAAVVINTMTNFKHSLYN